MTENETTETVDVMVEKPSRKAKDRNKPKDKAKAKAKARAKAKVPRDKVEDLVKPEGFDFVGKVESLRVKSGAGGFEFGLKGRHGKRRTFRIDATDALAMNAMAHLVLAAHASETKIGVRTGAEVEGVLVVRELETRPRIGKGI